MDIKAIEKMGLVLNWYNWQNYDFAYQFKSISQLEKIYDFATANNFEFMDNDFFNNADFEPGEIEKAKKFIKEILNEKDPAN